MKNYNKLIIIIFILISILMGIQLYRPIDKTLDRRDVICTVTDKSIKNYGGSGVYLIYGKNSENTSVYEISDSLLLKRFNSSDVYAKIEVGSTYIFNIGGHRNHFFSWYPNIYTYELLEGVNNV